MTIDTELLDRLDAIRDSYVAVCKTYASLVDEVRRLRAENESLRDRLASAVRDEEHV